MVIYNPEKVGHRLVTFLFVGEVCQESAEKDTVIVWDGLITVKQPRKQNILLGCLNILFVNFTGELFSDGL